MSRLMDRAEQALVEKVARHTRCYARITRSKRGGEGMRGEALAAALSVLAELRHQLQAVLDLHRWFKPAIKGAVVHCVRVPRDVGDQGHDRALELGEDRLELVG